MENSPAPQPPSRCNRDSLSIEAATEQALATGNREPPFHISSPLDGWKGAKPERHHDFITSSDFPQCWRGLDMTVEVEAMAKELAVMKLKKALEKRGSQGTP